MRILSILALLSLGACALPSLEVQPRYARYEISGSAGVASGGVSGSADVEQAGLDDDDTFAGRVDFEFGSPHVIGLAQAPRFEGSGTLDVTIDDGTNTITAGAAVDSEIELEMYDLALVFDLVPGDTVEVALGFGAAYLDVAMRFEELGTGTVIEEQEALPIPLLCAAASVWIGPLEVNAFAGGMDASYEGDSVTYLDLDAYARLKLFGGGSRLRASLVAGYRLTDFELEYEDASTNVHNDLTIAGPYVGLEVSL